MSRHPLIKWSQRSDKLFITVELPDAKNVKLNLEPEGNFFFSATSGADNIPYEIDIDLYDKVDVNESKASFTSRNMCYLVRKAESKWWSRLLKQEGKPPVFIKVDWDKWVDEDEQDEKPGADMDFGDIDFSQLNMGGVEDFDADGAEDFDDFDADGADIDKDMDLDLDEVLRSLPAPGSDEGFAPIDDIDFDLGGTMDSLAECGHESDDSLPAPLKREKSCDRGVQQPSTGEASQLLDDLLEVVPPPVEVGGSPGHATLEREGSPLPDFRFPSSRGYSEMRAVKSLVAPWRVDSVACRSADDIERVMSVYTQRTVALQVGLAESCRRLTSKLKELKIFAEEKEKEAHRYKKKLSSSRKSVEDLELEVNNLRSTLARAPEEAVAKYKASTEYTKDVETSIEQYKSSADFAKELNSYGGKVMAASIKLTKEWVSTEHPSVDPTGYDGFLAKRPGKADGAPQPKTFGQTSRGGSEETLRMGVLHFCLLCEGDTFLIQVNDAYKFDELVDLTSELGFNYAELTITMTFSLDPMLPPIRILSNIMSQTKRVVLAALLRRGRSQYVRDHTL